MRKFVTVCLTLLLIFSLTVPASAAFQQYVMDEAGLLTQPQQEELNRRAGRISESYGIGIYIMAVEDFRDYGQESEIFDVLWEYYHDNSLGYGPEREGMILMLSMDARDYATFFYGENTEYAFNAYGQIKLEEEFLDNFGEDDWYGGFLDYLTVSEDFMAKAAAGEPVRDNPWTTALLFVAVVLVVCLVITWIQWMRMSNVAIGGSADAYRTSEGLVLSRREDRFVYQTVTRRKIETSSSGSGSSRAHSGGGGSGRSGKF